MSLIQKYCVLVLIVVLSCVLVENRSYNNGLIFYDLNTKHAFLPPTVSVSRGRGLANMKFSEKGSIWSTFGKPCDCTGPLCGCCVGIKVKQYNFDQKMCANVSYVQPKEEINLEVFLNEKQSAKYAVSARNPAPFCIPVMVGIPMSMCVQLTNVGLQGDNMNACMDYMVQLASTQLFEMHFQCMQMGLQGIQWVVPGGAPVIPPSQSKITDLSEAVSDEYYDEEEHNEINTADEQGNVNEVNDQLENDENKAEEELYYNDLEENVSAGNNEDDEGESQDNEVVLIGEKEKQTEKEILEEPEQTEQTPVVKDEKPNSEEISEVASIEVLTNSGEIPNEATNNESDFNQFIETTTEQTWDKTTDNEQVIMVVSTDPTVATATIEYNDIDRIDNALTTSSIMTSTTTTTTSTTTSTTKTPTLTAPKTTETTAAAATTASAVIENNDSDNSQDNDSDYGDEESDEDDDGAEEEEEEEDDIEDDAESEDSEDVEEAEKKTEQTPHATSTKDDNENASITNIATNSIDHHDDEGEVKEENDSENEEYDGEDEDQEETETAASAISNESQLINNGFITPKPSATEKVSPDGTEKTVHKTDAHSVINSTNPQLLFTDAMLNISDTSSSSSAGNIIHLDSADAMLNISDTSSNSSAGNSAHVESATLANIVNMSKITATATPLTRASKLLTLSKRSHPEQQQQWHYQHRHQLHQHQARHQRN